MPPWFLLLLSMKASGSEFTGNQEVSWKSPQPWWCATFPLFVVCGVSLHYDVLFFPPVLECWRDEASTYLSSQAYIYTFIYRLAPRYSLSIILSVITQLLSFWNLSFIYSHSIICYQTRSYGNAVVIYHKINVISLSVTQLPSCYYQSLSYHHSIICHESHSYRHFIIS